ncbi:hypothetical protein CRUP_020529, partial [Coryphaenoides rupestris]
MSRHRISYLRHCGADENPFDRGAARNLWGFFCVVGGGGVVWEQVYFREGSDPVGTSMKSRPWGSMLTHMPCRWLSRKSSRRRNLTPHSERQSLQYTATSSSGLQP